jgi:hypothetical protein
MTSDSEENRTAGGTEAGSFLGVAFLGGVGRSISEVS